jgi:hypothetical protein
MAYEYHSLPMISRVYHSRWLRKRPVEQREDPEEAEDICSILTSRRLVLGLGREETVSPSIPD